ncbi:Uncharacterised protein [Zhongshania aliphaticivorans]|uniref:HTH tetR-type domain-containing protein n=1 Tax=Zhongshania aliphaticivorans TaxID=1470434 RepID=A0A5S9MU26_9GAMM|nr:TetR/AcrR family transcriptional regulator [Zhongshania aliphaticivorans]CAA0079549.1 Uncharacterised protein [Zhongshania aliphaticivorans]CAA0086091.1 Uncharacterised protein [Zhongshania aliphaticivorans]
MQHEKKSTPNRMIKRKNRTRKQLIDAAVQLVLNKGYDKVMTDEITELADVGRRTFYNHFNNKRDCIKAAVVERYVDYAEELNQLLKITLGLKEEINADPALIITTMATGMFQRVVSDPLTEQLLLYPQILKEVVAENKLSYLISTVKRELILERCNPQLPIKSLESILYWGFVGLVVDSITRNTQKVDKLTWGRFVLQTLGIDQAEHEQLLEAAELIYT